MRKIGEIVVTVYGWAGVVTAISKNNEGKIIYSIVDEDCKLHRISENSIV